jgi:hybrid cluster-associated redox disulfide protein
MPPEITRSISIGELVMNYPAAVEVLFSHGFHCIGCGLSAYETLEQGAAAHGYDDAMIDQIVLEIKEAAKKAESSGLAAQMPAKAESGKSLAAQIDGESSKKPERVGSGKARTKPKRSKK